jgi:hypothetical protein
MKVTADRISSFCWISYLTVIIPACILCVFGIILMVRQIWISDNGVIETLQPSNLKTALIVLAMLGLPVLWTLGVTIGHSFNMRWKTVIPFLAHLLPVILFMLEFWPDRATREIEEFLPIFGYFSLAVILLIVGVIAAVVSNLKKEVEQVGDGDA